MKENAQSKMAKRSIRQEAEAILLLAEEKCLDDNPIFRTQYRILLRLVKTLDQLEQSLDEDGVTVTKAYVKGRENTYLHPAVTAFKETAISADKIISGIRKTFKDFEGDTDSSDIDPLMEALKAEEDDNDNT